MNHSRSITCFILTSLTIDEILSYLLQPSIVYVSYSYENQLKIFVLLLEIFRTGVGIALVEASLSVVGLFLCVLRQNCLQFVVMVLARFTEGFEFEPRVGSTIISKIDFPQHKLSSQSIAFDIKLEGALYSVFYAEACKIPWISLNKWSMCQTPKLVIIYLIQQSLILDDATAQEH